MMIRFLALLATFAAIILPAQAQEDFGASFAERFPRTFATLEADFPADLAALRTQLTAVGSGGQSQMLQQIAGYGALRDLRQKYADRLLFSTPNALGLVLVRLADFYDAVFERGGLGTCGQFAQNGSGVLYQLSVADQYAEELDAQADAYFRAVVAAIETPDAREAASEDDWRAVLGTMIGMGAPPSYAVSALGGQASDPDLCPALAAMFRASAALDKPEGWRVRADLARNLAGY